MPYADTLQIFETLRQEFDEKQAKVIAASIETALETNNKTLIEKVATKEDIADLQTEFKTEMANLRTEFKTEMANLRTEFKTEMANLRTDIANQKAEIIKWNFIFWVGLLPVMAALIKFIR